MFVQQGKHAQVEEKNHGRRRVTQRLGATPEQILDRKMDVTTGTFCSNLVMYFIILTTD
jgi:hypothetical protein